MDVTCLQAADTAAIHLKDAAGNYLYDDVAQTKPVRIVIYGPGSKQAAAVESRQTARIVRRMQANDGKPVAPTAEEMMAEQAEDLAALTAGFENLEYSPAKGKHGIELFEAFYGDRKLGFLHQQVVKGHRDWEKFKGGSAKG